MNGGTPLGLQLYALAEEGKEVRSVVPIVARYLRDAIQDLILIFLRCLAVLIRRLDDNFPSGNH